MKSKARPTTPRPPEEVWKAIEEQAMDHEMQRILALSDEELDAELRAAGFDPEVERELGPKQAREAAAAIEAREKREAELGAARQRLAARRARRVALDRETLLARIEAARNDARLPERATMLFRNRGTQTATDRELEDMLDELEDIIEQHERKS
jgi:hypothetical protein